MSTKTSGNNRLMHIIRFLRVSRLLFWTIWVIYRERRRVVHAYARGNYAVRPDGDMLIEVLATFRATALELGALMIKLGQFLSSRPDLLPEKAIAILSSLQDEVPPAPFAYVISVIESELGKPVEEVFSVLERKCTAAASLGQVHKAILASTGETVAVKIQRPDIEQLVRMDLSALKFVIWIITRFVNMNGFIDLMGIYHKFQRMIYEEIDYVREAANARWFKEMFKDDPMIYIPFGFIDKGANLASIERAMTLMIERYYGMTLGEASELEIPEMLQDVAYLLYGQPFHIPAQFAFTGRAVGILAGVSTGLSPEFNFVEVATPYARKFLGLDTQGAQRTLQQLFSQLLDAGRVWFSLPRSLEQLLTRLEAGQIEVKLASNGPSGWNGFRRRRLGRDNSESSGIHPFTWLFMFVASLAGGIFLLIDAHQLIAAWFCFGLAGLFALGMLVKS